jgi:hypothetical protein
MVNSLDVVTIVVTGLTVCIFGFAAFWAVSMTRVMRVRLYRRHALGVVIVALGFALLDVESVFLDYSDLVVPVIFLTLFVLFIIIFYFIDTAILSARRADPLLRDTAGWQRRRKLVWVLMVASVAIAIGTSVAGYSGFGGIFLLPFIIAGVLGGYVLPLAARRSKDFTFNRHLKRFGAFILFGVGWFLAWFVGPALWGPMDPNTLLMSPLTDQELYLADLLALVGFSGAGYFLYRSARALAPLNRITPPDEP